MPLDQASAAAPANRFLAKLPRDEYQVLAPHLKSVKLSLREIIYEFKGPIDFVYFPTGAVFSALTTMKNGDAIEVATIGTEGIVGHIAASSGRISANKVIVQISDGSLRIEAGILREVATRGGSLRELLDGYDDAYRVQVSQSVACNGLHRLEQRCCRWLLMTRDRVASDDMGLSHEFLAIMLGARRASVTAALKPLQEAGMVRSHRGRISILDRAAMEELVCECYWTVKREYDLLLD